MLTIKQKSINLLLSFIFHKYINNKIDKKHIAKNKILLPNIRFDNWKKIPPPVNITSYEKNNIRKPVNNKLRKIFLLLMLFLQYEEINSLFVKMGIK